MKADAVLIALCLCGPLAGGKLEEGFAPLFDGRTLAGWHLVNGAGEGYIAKDGMLVCPLDGGGALLTDKEYANFVLRFEYRTEPGGNNGIGIRVPAQGHPSYDGMEIQILDDQHDKYKGWLRPEQHTGSIYDVVPARTRFQKPGGEWNEEEIRAEGSRIRVTLNGEVIVDFDLSLVQSREVLKKHPGIRRTAGHIGLLGHKSFVEFRNLRIKTLPLSGCRGLLQDDVPDLDPLRAAGGT